MAALPKGPNENPILDTVDSIISSIVQRVGVKLTVLAIQSSLPFLKFALFDWMLHFFIGKIGAKIFEAISPFVSYNIIKFDNEEDRVKFEEAKKSLQQAIDTGDIDVIQKESQRFDDAFDKLVTFGGH